MAVYNMETDDEESAECTYGNTCSAEIMQVVLQKFELL